MLRSAISHLPNSKMAAMMDTGAGAPAVVMVTGGTGLVGKAIEEFV